MTDALDRQVDHKLAELGLTRADVGDQAVAALRTRLTIDDVHRDPLAAAYDHDVATIDRARREPSEAMKAARDQAQQEFARDVAEALHGHTYLQAPDDLISGGQA